MFLGSNLSGETDYTGLYPVYADVQWLRRSSDGCFALKGERMFDRSTSSTLLKLIIVISSITWSSESRTTTFASLNFVYTSPTCNHRDWASDLPYHWRIWGLLINRVHERHLAWNGSDEVVNGRVPWTLAPGSNSPSHLSRYPPPGPRPSDSDNKKSDNYLLPASDTIALSDLDPGL